jgi:competence protein ComGC
MQKALESIKSMTTRSNLLVSTATTKGFTLIEVVLAIGIFLLSILALVGLLAPTLSSIDDVSQADEVISVVNTVNAFLMNSPDIAPNGSRFNAVYQALQAGHNGVLTIFVFRQFEDATSAEEQIKIGFSSAVGIRGIDPLAVISSFENAAGPIYRVLLSASSVTPVALRNGDGTGYPGYTLREPLGNYPEGYLAMEVRIFAELSQPAPVLGSDPAAFVNRQPIFTYNMAIVR